jgi:hypothetical protein
MADARALNLEVLEIVVCDDGCSETVFDLARKESLESDLGRPAHQLRIDDVDDEGVKAASDMGQPTDVDYIVGGVQIFWQTARTTGIRPSQHRSM